MCQVNVCRREGESRYKLRGPMVQKGALDRPYYVATFLGSVLFVDCTI